MKEFCEIYDLHNLIKEPTCFKNAKNPSSIDVILTNRKGSFQNSMVIETGLSDHHKMTITVLKTYYKKKEPIIGSIVVINISLKLLSELIYLSVLKILKLKPWNMMILGNSSWKC